MKLSNKQQLDLKTVQYFIPAGYPEATEQEIERYFAWSDYGRGKETAYAEALQTNTGFSGLYWGKQRRDLQVTSYKEDWGTFITSVDFVDEPKFLVQWLAKIMKKPKLFYIWQLFNEPDEAPLEELREDFAILLPYTA